MGMYDYIRCEYPLPDDHGSITGWQTKSLDCQLETYTITADGRLTGPCSKHPQIEEIQIDGDVRFYAQTKPPVKEWVEYRATFRGGRLVELTRIPLQGGEAA